MYTIYFRDSETGTELSTNIVGDKDRDVIIAARLIWDELNNNFYHMISARP